VTHQIEHIRRTIIDPKVITVQAPQIDYQGPNARPPA
jgi:hypothetical protein